MDWRFWHWPRLELTGYGIWLLGGAMFAVPEIWASRDSDLPFPTLSGTVGHLERRWEIASLLVLIVIANALLHAVRIGGALVAGRIEQTATTGPGGAPLALETPTQTMSSTVQLRPGKHVALAEGRITRTAGPEQLGWGLTFVYFICTCAAITFGFLIPFWIHGSHATDAEKQLSGEVGYGAMGLMFFIIPALLAYAGKLLPFPGLFATVVNLERRAQVVAVLVAGCMAFLTLHLVFYPYPSIIPWFVDLNHLHNHCIHHATDLICRSR